MQREKEGTSPLIEIEVPEVYKHKGAWWKKIKTPAYIETLGPFETKEEANLAEAPD